MKQTDVESKEPPEDDEEDVVDGEEEFLDVEGDVESDAEDTIVFSNAKNSDNVGDVSVEINVEELIAEFESSQNAEAARKKEIRRRLEEIREQRQAMKELEDTFSFDMNEDED
jgi:predicted FMN-binding regulatory protein PaiB